LRTGQLTATLVDGALRDVCLSGRRVLDAVYAAVRDPDWGTVPGHFTSYTLPAPDVVEFVCRHDGFFEWRGRIETRDGTIMFDFDGHALSSFAANRIGFCVLHPIDFAGQPVVARTRAGEFAGCFPDRISPHQPFTDLTGLAYGSLKLAFSGALFEMEDHRNWTDAGFKTYCTPLRVPYPVNYRPGDRVRQTVAISSELEVVVGDEVIGHMPEVGSLSVELRSGFSGALPLAAHPAGTASTTRCVAVTVFAPAVADWEGIAASLAPHGQLIERVAVFDEASRVTQPGMAPALRAALRDAGVTVAVGGGSGANFAELNRMSLPVSELDFVCYGVNPMVHHTDDESVMDTLLAQPHALRDAKLIAAGLPVVVGPISLPRPELAQAWMIGSIAAMIGAHALAYAGDGVERGPADLTGQPVYRVGAPPRELAALAVGSYLWLANLRGAPCTARLADCEIRLGPYEVVVVP
jgi:hypothetical protein